MAKKLNIEVCYNEEDYMHFIAMMEQLPSYVIVDVKEEKGKIFVLYTLNENDAQEAKNYV